MSSHDDNAKGASGSSSEGGNLEVAGTEATNLTKQWSIRPWLLTNVDTKLAYIPMLVCCFVSGLTDSTMFNGKHGSYQGHT